MGRLSLNFEDIMKELSIERKSDGKLYYSDGTECNVQRALSTSFSCSERYVDFSKLSPESQRVFDKIKWF